MILIGESLNAAIPAVKEAIISRNVQFVTDLAKQQVEHGANMLDANAGIAKRDEYSDLKWLINVIQDSVDVPLVLDSSNPEVLVSLYNECHLKPLLNSISVEPRKLEILLPFLVTNGCSIVGVCVEGKGIPSTAEGTFKVAKLLIDKITEARLDPGNLYIDPGVLSLTAECNAGLKTLAAIKLIKEYQPKVKIICAVSNISFGLPQRTSINQNFIPMLVNAGADALIFDVRDYGAVTAVLVSETLVGKDDYCMNYIRAYRSGRIKHKVK